MFAAFLGSYQNAEQKLENKTHSVAKWEREYV